MAKLDRQRKGRGNNDDWHNPRDPDAKITKMKDGTTHLAQKAEHAVDLGEDAHGVILAVNECDAIVGDTNTLCETIDQASENLAAIKNDDRVSDTLGENWASEAVADTGYHSNGTMTDLRQMRLRSYISELARGRRNWRDAEDGAEARDATYANAIGSEASGARRCYGVGVSSSNAHSLTTMKPA